MRRAAKKGAKDEDDAPQSSGPVRRIIPIPKTAVHAGLWRHASEIKPDRIADADGCVERLYHYLWTKNGEGKSCPGICIPDTVRYVQFVTVPVLQPLTRPSCRQIVYKYRLPSAWYFSSKQDGMVSSIGPCSRCSVVLL